MKTMLLCFLIPFTVFAKINIGDKAPLFSLKDQSGRAFNLAEQKGKKWSVIFFYPKAGTPGCTKQVCAFRDSIKEIQALNADVFGISADSIEAQAKFHQEHRLAFRLLADPKMEAIQKYGVKMEGAEMAKRWTFIIDPSLTIRVIDEKVDPVADPGNVANRLSQLQKS